MISDELKTIFIHSPRTGGTSIEYALVGNDYWQIDPERKHISCSEAEEIYKEKWKDYFTFSIVRNPYCRAISLWKYRQKRILHTLSDQTLWKTLQTAIRTAVGLPQRRSRLHREIRES